MAHPVVYVENGIVFDDKTRGYAVFVVDAEERPSTSAATLNQSIATVARGMREVIGDWHLYSLAIGVPSNNWEKRFVRTDHPINKQHVKEARDLVEDILFERRIYIVVPISPKITIRLQENTREFLKEMGQSVFQSAKRLLNMESLRVQLLEQMADAQRKWLRGFRSFLKLHIASQAEIETWLRHGYYRGVVAPESRFPKHLPKFVSSDGVIHPKHHVGVWTEDGAIDERLFSLKIIRPDDVSYQTFYNMLTVPNEIDAYHATDHDWVHQIELMNIPVDAALHVRVEDHITARKNLRKKRLASDAKANEYREGGELPPEELEVDIENADELEQKLRARDPLVHVKTVIGFGAMDEQTLADYRKSVIGEMTLTDLVQAPADQKRLWQAFYPWGEPVQTAYEIPMDAGTLAAGLPFTTTEFGDPQGFYLGYTVINERSVFMDPRRPAQEMNMQPSILLCGGLGSGKTSTAQYITTNLISWGAKAFIQDPKGHDYDHLYRIGAKVNIIRLREEGAKLNPFRLGVDGIGRDLLDIILNNVTSDDNTRDIRSALIGQAMTIVRHGETQDMDHFGDALTALLKKETREKYVEQVELLLAILNDVYHNELGRVLFAPDTHETPQQYDATIVDTSGLNIPPSGVARTLSERLSMALYYAVAGMGMGYFSNLPNSMLKVMVLDEAWTLRKFAQGLDLVDNLLRKSRALNIIPLMLMQNATDFENWGESIDGLFAWRFILRQNSQTETKAAMKLAGLDHEDMDTWFRRFGGFSSGEGIVVDALGRVKRMQVEMKPEELLTWFDTNPKTKINSHEAPLS